MEALKAVAFELASIVALSLFVGMILVWGAIVICLTA